MIKTPLSTMIGGAFWTPNATIIGGQQSFSQLIKELFSNGEQGFAYDPNDLTTMFQNTLGNIPVTGEGQTVGLVLDKSKGLAQGTEVITNGTFEINTSGWTAKNSQISVINGRMAVYNPTGALDGQAGQRIETLLTPNKRYKLSVTGSKDSTAADWQVLVETGASTIVNIVNTISKTVEVYFFAPAAGNTVTLRLRCTTLGGTAYFDDVSVKELSGNHAYQTTSSMRPLLKDSPRRIDYDAVDDKLTVNLPAQLTGCTVIRAVPNVGTQILTNQTIPTPYNDNTDHCGLIVINRALTTTETSQITKLFNKAAGV